VLPFKPISADARDEYFELGMADALITKLGSLKGIIVRPTTSVRRYADVEQDAMAAGQELQVESVLVGSTQRLGDRVRLTVQLVNVSDGRSLWSYKCDDYCADIFTAQDSISEKIATALALKLNDEERRRLSRHDTENLDAYDLYLKGRYRWDRGTVKEVLRSIEYFEQAIKLDPNYTLAYTGLADAYFYLEGLGAFPSKEVGPKARYAALKALELDEGLAETHASLGLIKHWHDWDWVGAEREFKRVELHPNSLCAQPLWKCLADTGRFDEASQNEKGSGA
jgi:TolB-like protein